MLEFHGGRGDLRRANAEALPARGLGRNAAGSEFWGARTRLTKHLGNGSVLAAGGAGEGVLLALPDVAGASVGSCGIRHVCRPLDRARDLAWALPGVFPYECDYFS